MRKELKAYLKEIREIDKKEKVKNKTAVIEELSNQIKFTQHERIVHLIVTVFVGLSTLLLLGLGITTELLGFVYVSLITLVLFFFYILHYYFLENTTQELYKHYFSIKEKKAER